MSDEWYKRDIRAAIRGMTSLTLEERGAYNTIIDHQYLMGRGLADNDAYLAGLMGCDVRVWKRVKKQLLDKGRIVISGGLIEDVRASCTIATRQVKRSQPTARPDTLSKSTSSVSETNNLETASSSKDAPREEEKREEVLGLTPESRARGPDTFPAFWARYPNKTGKPKAQAAYRSALNRATADEIAAGLERYIASKPPDRQWLNPTTFLNQDRWGDEPALVERPSTGPPRPRGYGDVIERAEAFLRTHEPPPDEPPPHDLDLAANWH